MQVFIFIETSRWMRYIEHFTSLRGIPCFVLKQCQLMGVLSPSRFNRLKISRVPRFNDLGLITSRENFHLLLETA